MIEERYYQPQAVKCTVDYMYAHKGNPLIALPTGTGKSVVIVLLILALIDRYLHTRALVVTHSMELVEQNAKKMRMIAPHIPVGVNCDGLGQRDTMQPAIFGSIGSVVTMVHLIGPVDVIIIDEAHRVSEDEDSQYSKLIIAAKLLNPHVVIIGLSATPFDNYGKIIRHDEKTGECTTLFTEFSYSKITAEDFAEFVQRGWLSPLIAKSTDTRYNWESVGVTAGDYNQGQMQKVADQELLTRQAVAECIYMKNVATRHCGLAFASGIKHAEHVAEEFQAQGSTAVFVHSKMSKAKRDDAMECFHAAEAEWMVNNGVLTTGYDHPPIDIMAIIRKMGSVNLWGQMLGRGTRPYDFMNPAQYIPGFDYTKYNCLVLDFGSNTEHLGPIDAPFFKKPKKGEPGDAPVKICPQGEKDKNDKKGCGVYNYASARHCHLCGFEFSFEVKYEAKSASTSPMSLGEALQVWKDVTFINYSKITPRVGPPIMKATYHCGGLDKYDELVCLEHTSRAADYARDWWRIRTDRPVPGRVDDALNNTNWLRRPTKICLQFDPGAKYPKVINYVF